jgi:hypothetical protein
MKLHGEMRPLGAGSSGPGGSSLRRGSEEPTAGGGAVSQR